MTTNYAIARIKKYSKVSQVGYLVNHHLRSVPVANANQQIKNEVLSQVANIKDFLEDIPKGSKTNAVRFVDCLFTASRFDSKRQLDEWKAKTMEFVKKTYGAENIALAVLHKDETTQHIHVIVKPINPKTQKLGAGWLFDGRDKMQAYQDQYHTAVGSLGFSRGVKGSRAKHQTIKQFYRNISKAETEANEFRTKLTEAIREVEKIPKSQRLFSDTFKEALIPIFGRLLQKAKIVAGLEKVLQAEKKEELANKLASKVEHLEMKLEAITGAPNPSWDEIHSFANSFVKLTDEHAKLVEEVKKKYPTPSPPQDTKKQDSKTKPEYKYR